MRRFASAMTASARGFVLPRLDQRNVILEVNGDDRVPTGDEIDTVTEFF